MDDSTNELYFILWGDHSRDSKERMLLCNCLVGALPYSQYVMRSSPLCGVRALHPAQYYLTRQNQIMVTAKKKEKHGTLVI